MRRFFGVLLLYTLACPLPGEESAQKVVKGPVVGSVQTDRATLTWVTHRVLGALRKEGSAEAIAVDRANGCHPL